MSDEDAPDGFKMTEIGILPIGWSTKTLGELSVGRKKSIDPRDFSNEEFEYYSIPAYQNGRIPLLVRGASVGSQKLLLDEGTILFGKLNPKVEKIWEVGDYSNRRKIGSTEWLPICPSRTTSGNYLLHLLWSDYVMPIAKSKVSGSTPSRQRVDPDSFYSIRVPVPSLPEQKNIAFCLSTVQEVKSKTLTVLSAVKELKKSLIRHLFTYGPVSTMNTRKVSLKETEIGMMPETWRTERLGNLAELITKGSSPKWQGFDYSSSGIVFVRSQNIGWGRLNLDDIAHLPKEFNIKERKSIILEEDLLVNIVGASIGRASVANKQVAGGNLNQAVALVRSGPRARSAFLMNYVLTESGQGQLEKHKKEIARANLSLQDIGNLIVPLPELDTQLRIVQMISSVDERIENLERCVMSASSLFRALLSNLLTGKLRVNKLGVLD